MSLHVNGHRLSSATAVLFMAALLVSPCSSSAQTQNLSLADIFDPQLGIDFDGNPPRDFGWLDDENYLQRISQGRSDPAELVKVNAVTGFSSPLFDVEVMESILAEFPGIGVEDARRLSRQTDHLMNATTTALIFEHTNDLYHYNLETERVSRLTRSPEPEQQVSFSPSGDLVAFVRQYDLYIVDVVHGREYPLTVDGNKDARNGLLNWVYQEEIYGRGNFKGYWWSPDSARLAYLRLDDTEVPTYPVVDHIPYHPVIEEWNYPKAGDQNPTVKLGIVRSSGGDTTWVDLSEYDPIQPLVVDVGWSLNSEHVVFQVQDREQTWLDLNTASHSGQKTLLLRETTQAWVNVNGPPTWLEDGSFLWLSERDGWKHLYHHHADGSLSKRLTAGQWEVRTLHGIDEQTGWVYFSGTKRSITGSDVYRVRLNGENLTRLTKVPGTHRAQFSPKFSYYINTHSTINNPPTVQMQSADGRDVRVIHENQVTALSNYRLTDPEFLQIENREGFVMEAMMIKPPDFDPTRRYPVYQHVYGGPHVQRVRNAWLGSPYLFWQLLAQHGIIVWVMDNSTASGKGATSTWPIYKRFGELELNDIQDGLAWLGEQDYVDIERVGIEGWSYGGFMVSYALTHSQSFVMGIAGGSVTDWRDYDTIYTERFMRMPQNNPEGYAQSAPRFSAAELSGALLLVHGTMDENVHMQNTLQFAYELQRAGKPFEMMLYPRSRHRLGGPQLEMHRHKTMLDFSLRHLFSNTNTKPGSGQH